MSFVSCAKFPPLQSVPEVCFGEGEIKCDGCVLFLLEERLRLGLPVLYRFCFSMFKASCTGGNAVWFPSESQSRT
eukprot:149885-Prymnesium_polylepis.1